MNNFTQIKIFEGSAEKVINDWLKANDVIVLDIKRYNNFDRYAHPRTNEICNSWTETLIVYSVKE